MHGYNTCSDSPTPLWVVAAGRVVLAMTGSGGTGEELEGIAAVPALAILEAIRRSICACCSGVKVCEGSGCGTCGVEDSAAADVPGASDTGGVLSSRDDEVRCARRRARS